MVIYPFQVDQDRNDLLLPGPCTKIYQNPINVGAEDVIFGDGFGGVTDLTVAQMVPIRVSIGHGKIFRIMPE